MPHIPPRPDGIAPTAPWAEYAIASAQDEGQFALEFRRAPYDVAALRHSYETSGRPFAEEEIARYRRPS